MRDCPARWVGLVLSNDPEDLLRPSSRAIVTVWPKRTMELSWGSGTTTAVDRRAVQYRRSRPALASPSRSPTCCAAVYASWAAVSTDSICRSPSLVTSLACSEIGRSGSSSIASASLTNALLMKGQHTRLYGVPLSRFWHDARKAADACFRPYTRLSIDQVSFPQRHLKMRKGRGKTLKKSSPGFSYKE